MDFSLSEEHRMLQKMVRDLTEKEVAPIAIEIDREARFPTEIFGKMGELGLLGAPIPTQYGGKGMDLLAQFIIIEELGRILPGLSDICLITSGVIAYGTVYRSGTERQKQKYLGPLCRGEMVGAIGMTEPNAGSDIAAIETTAVRDGEHYVINGTKTMISNFGAPLPSVAAVLTVTNKSKGTKGMSTFLVEKDTPGITISNDIETCGFRCSSMTQIVFENCRVPVANLIGEEGQGLKVSLSSIDIDRIMGCALSTGIAQGAFDRALRYAKNRVAFGQPISNFQAVQLILSKMAIGIQAARFLGYHAVWIDGQGSRCTTEAAMARRFSSGMAQEATINAMHILGGYGFTTEYEVERLFRDNMAVDLSSELMDLVVARGFIG